MCGMNRLLITASLLTSCATTAPVEQPVTRQAPPLVAPTVVAPARQSGTPSKVSADWSEKVARALKQESQWIQVEHLSGIRWEDGTETIFVTHQRFPATEMSEAAFQRVIDEDKLEQCDREFRCDVGDCDESGYELCSRAAYSDPYVYMSSIGEECGLYELSRFDIDGAEVSLRERVPLGEVACGLLTMMHPPSGIDIDQDGGPELTYAWTSVDFPTPESQRTIFSTVVLDANTLREQLRWRRAVEQEEAHEVHKLTPRPREDGRVDLIADAISIQIACLDVPWAHSEPLITVAKDDF